MGLLAPLALLFLPLLALIAAFYLLRLRRPEAAVSSLYLWDTLLRDREANAPWQRLRTSLLLLLQLLIAAALILALTRPWTAAGVAAGRNLILILDTSASMASLDGPDNISRIARARSLAQERADTVPGNGTVTVIAGGAGATVLLARSNDRTAIRAAIGGAQAGPGPTDLRAAFALAAALAGGQADSEVAVYSDGRFPDPRDTVPQIRGLVRYVPVGSRDANQGIVALALRRNAGNVALFVQVVNGSQERLERRLDIDLDGQPWSGRNLALAGGDTQGVIFDDVPPATQVVHARLAGNDDLALDNEAWTVNRLADPLPVLMVTAGNRFLQNALVLLPNVRLEKAEPAAYAPSPTATLTVFDRWVPGELPPGNLLFIAPPQSTALFQVTGVLTTPLPSAPTADALAREPLLRLVDLSNLHIAQAQHVAVPEWGRVVLDSDQGPLLIAGETGGRRVIILTFALHDSDLPVQIAYPLLIRNLTGWLLPEPAGGLPANVAAGTALDLAADPGAGVTRLTVEPPEGGPPATTYQVDATHTRFTYAATHTLGVYVVTQWAGAQAVRREGFAVNLADGEESRTRPRLGAAVPAQVPQVAGEAAQAEWWPLAAAAALLVLLIEWLVVNQLTVRRLVARLRERWGRRAPAEGV